MSHEPLDPSIPINIFTDRQRLSYATIGRLFLLSLEAIGLAVDENGDGDVTKYIGGQTLLHNTIGPNFRPIAGAFNVALPAHEWSRYPARWAKNLNRFDEAWVTTEHVRNVLKDSGVSIPIRFLPPALEFDSPPQKTDWDFGEPIKFFSCGEPHFRKGFHLLMEGYMRAFPAMGEAELYIKTSPGCGWKAPREDIFIIAEDMEREKLLLMYKEFDAYITASLGEGLGLPIAEAVMAKTPVAANFWGGHASLLKEGAFWQIDHNEVPQLFCSEPRFYAMDQKCAYSSPAMIADAIGRIVKSTALQRKAMADTARKHLIETYGKETATERFKKRFGLTP